MSIDCISFWNGNTILHSVYSQQYLQEKMEDQWEKKETKPEGNWMGGNDD